jgi:hypothetical protein
VIESLLQIAFLLALAGLVGTPPAALLDNGRSGPWVVITEGLVLGVLWFGLSGVALARWFESSAASIAGTSAVFTVVCVAAAARRGVLPIPRQPSGFVLTIAAILSLAAIMRAQPVHFLFQIGDFGQYVAQADTLARSGEYPGGFLPHLTVLLASAQHVVGPDDVTIAASALGVLLVAMLALTLMRLRVPRLANAGVLTIVAVGAVPTWYGAFPATETLYSVLLVSLVYFLAKSAEHGQPGDFIAVGLVAIGLGLTRGNAFPLVFVLAFSVILLTPQIAPPQFRRFAYAVGVTCGAVWLTTLFATEYHYNYFVGTQLAAFVPDRLFPLAESLDDPVPAAVGTALVVLGVIALVQGAQIVNHRLATSDATGPRWAWSVALGVVALGGTGLIWALGSAEVVDSVVDYGALLLGLAAVGVVMVLTNPGRGPRTVIGVVAVLVVVAYAALHAYRLPELAEHAFYRYWQRYLFSEVFPMLAVLAGLGASGLIRWWSELRHGVLRTGAAAVALLVAGGGLLQTLEEGALGRQHVLFDGDYELVSGLSRALAVKERPILYHGIGGLPGFPNTFRALGVPLQTSFDHQILNLPDGPFEEDPRVDAALLGKVGEETGPVYVLGVGGGTAPPSLATPATGHMSPPQDIEFQIPTLRHLHPEAHWESALLRVRIQTFWPGKSVDRVHGFGVGFAPPETGSDGHSFRWVTAPRSRFSIGKASSGEAEIVLRLQSFAQPRTARMLVDGKAVAEAKVPHTRTRRVSARVRLTPGVHSVEIVTSPGPQSIAETVGTADGRSVSVRIVEPVLVRSAALRDPPRHTMGLPR